MLLVVMVVVAVGCCKLVVTMVLMDGLVVVVMVDSGASWHWTLGVGGGLVSVGRLICARKAVITQSRVVMVLFHHCWSLIADSR